jgi:ribulose-5-phosphate 4-epimerase/fuculose-1-phosphate aldolase
MYGMTDLILTHLSVHLPGEGHRFLVNPYGLLFEEVTASSLVVVDAAGEPLQETTWPVNPAGFVIHSAIHIGRPDVRCVMHTHTLFLRGNCHAKTGFTTPASIHDGVRWACCPDTGAI